MPGELKADLVLEGGGVKGIALVGAINELTKAGYTFPRVAGTSAGAIVGALVAAGKPADELRAIMAATDYRKFQDESWLDKMPGGKILSVLLDDGVYEGKYFKTWLDGVLGDVKTFNQLALPDDPDSSLPAEQRYRLVVNVSDVSLGRLVRLPWDYQRAYGLEPDNQEIVNAVRGSMSLPLFFEPARLKYTRERDGRAQNVASVLIDGGMLSNFPVDIFDRTDGRRPRWPTFGLKLSTRPGALSESFPKDVDGPIELVKAMVGTMTSFRDAMHVDKEKVRARTIFIDTLDVKTTDFDIDDATQNALFESGANAAKKFLATWDFERYIDEYRSG